MVGAVVRIRVADLDGVVPFYERLTGEPAHRFAFGAARLASVGHFLLFAAEGDDGDRLERVVATLRSDDLDGDLERLAAYGAEVVAPPAATPNGRRAVLRHPDGSVFEYVGR